MQRYFPDALLGEPLGPQLREPSATLSAFKVLIEHFKLKKQPATIDKEIDTKND